MYKQAYLVIFMLMVTTAKAQRWALSNTGTLYDAFENPSQKTFQPDSSRRFAFNFLIPTGGFSYAGRGPAEKTIRQLFYLGPLDTRELDNNNLKYNRLFGEGNLYIGMLRYFKSVQYNREWGLSWQIKSEGDYSVTNQTFSLFYNPTIGDKTYFNNNLNDFGKGQAYHQLSISYRENYSRWLAFGAKLSYLSGMVYSNLDIKNSELAIDKETETFAAYFKGRYRTNFLAGNLSEKSSIVKLLAPFIYNPGLAITASFNYRTRRGLYILGNLKDIGFIYWRRTPYNYQIDGSIDVDADDYQTIDNQVKDYVARDILKDPTNEKFTSSTNGKAEVLLSKTYGNFQPNFIVSKSVFNDNGNIVLVNNYNIKSFKASLITGYDLRKIVEIGGQLMYKRPNVEIYLGSDRLFKTLMIGKGVSAMQADLQDRRQDETPSGSGYTGASAYFGFAMKFGKILYRWQNESYTPGVANVNLKNFKRKKKWLFF